MTKPVWWWFRWWWWGRLPAQQRALEAALGRLSICDTLPGAIPYHDRIPEIARQLTLMRRKDPPIARQAEQLKPVMSRLKALALGEEWDGISQGYTPASDNLPLPSRRKLIKLAAEAGELALEIEKHLSELPKPKRGRPEQIAAPQIAAYLHHEFARLTGRAPSRNVDLTDEDVSEFTVLVREVFAILGVKSDPEGAARSAIEDANHAGNKSEKRLN